MRVGVVGATGLVGGVMRSVLTERRFPVAELRVFASSRSAGRTLPWDGGEVTVEVAESADFAGIDIMLMAAGATASRALAPRVAAAGALVVDNSSAWRMDPDVPLVVSEVNPEAIDEARKGIVANPNCTTMVVMLPAKALDTAFGLQAMVCTSFQAAGGAGQKGIDELAGQVALLAADVQQLVDDGATAARKVEHA